MLYEASSIKIPILEWFLLYNNVTLLYFLVVVDRPNLNSWKMNSKDFQKHSWLSKFIFAQLWRERWKDSSKFWKEISTLDGHVSSQQLLKSTIFHLNKYQVSAVDKYVLNKIISIKTLFYYVHNSKTKWWKRFILVWNGISLAANGLFPQVCVQSVWFQ